MFLLITGRRLLLKIKDLPKELYNFLKFYLLILQPFIQGIDDVLIISIYYKYLSLQVN